ncbi:MULTISPECIES: flagellar biosynthetic protein FliR [unclassified Paenibacillus]|uniref:flagellar biosynthetic protein FliR n=1 Tax=unclassified Paenibacillus TaxID=185978 RepID=UPI00070DDCCD|nr:MULTISPECIES: flagellar biosynthetic protein FliR [unclassified Paenibacillus]KQX69177.1 flagellar biosynthetic protein FliR [Paenibacillus sp. Root444D2]KRE51723.1 flagellar biosynthetic protein FliR [Paenibacillus sp. Soil724D2]
MTYFFQVIPIFLLIFCRITSFFVVVPILSSRNVPMMFKIGLSVFISLIIFATMGLDKPIPMDGEYILLIIREMLVGVLLGFLAYIFFTVVQTAGSFMDMQIGFSMASVIDPLTGASSPMLGNLKYMIAVLLFLSFDGHHYLIRAIIDSYRWIPLDNQLFTRIYDGQISNFLFQSLSKMFYLSFQLAAPIIAALFLTDLGLGLLTRVAPQFNIFVIGAPLKMILGFFLLVIIFPELISQFQNLFATIFDYMEKLLQLISGTQQPSPK